ncbi:MAG: hypothetical protein KF745_11800 [Phycisphaeraceae bacterium]|nr:hypothetical protein [Phycisphaeraceae bacterium]
MAARLTSTRRLARFAAILILLGLATTVLLAWLPSLFPISGAVESRMSVDPDRRADYVWVVLEDSGVWYSSFTHGRYRRESLSAATPELDPASIPAWVAPRPESGARATVAFGLPFRSLKWVSERGQPNALNLPGLGALPWVPIWPGLLADTALWSIAFAALVALVHLPARWLRRSRGRCPRCGHDLRGAGSSVSGCSACGWNMEARRTK